MGHCWNPLQYHANTARLHITERVPLKRRRMFTESQAMITPEEHIFTVSWEHTPGLSTGNG